MAAIRIPSLPLLYTGLIVITSGFGFIQPSLHGLVSNWASADYQGSVLGVAQSFNALARIVGSAIGIPLLKRGVTLPYSSAMFLMLLTAGAVVLAHRWQLAATRSKESG
jgi:fucose permease